MILSPTEVRPSPELWLALFFLDDFTGPPGWCADGSGQTSERIRAAWAAQVSSR